MSSTKPSSGELKEIEQTAAGWGKLLAHEAFPEGPGLDVSLVEMEEIVAVATKAVVRGAIETMTEGQAQSLDKQLPCPGCGKLCEVKCKARPIAVRGGSAELHEAVGHCSTCRRDFFPSA